MRSCRPPTSLSGYFNKRGVPSTWLERGEREPVERGVAAAVGVQEAAKPHLCGVAPYLEDTRVPSLTIVLTARVVWPDSGGNEDGPLHSVVALERERR